MYVCMYVGVFLCQGQPSYQINEQDRYAHRIACETVDRLALEPKKKNTQS
jgi:hypothetical protein